MELQAPSFGLTPALTIAAPRAMSQQTDLSASSIPSVTYLWESFAFSTKHNKMISHTMNPSLELEGTEKGSSCPQNTLPWQALTELLSTL